MTAINAHLEQNGILARLPAKERKFLKEHLDLVSLRTKEELNELGSPVRHVHFPVNCAISLMDFKRGGGIVEVAVVGKEGCTGSTVVQGNRNACAGCWCRSVGQRFA